MKCNRCKKNDATMIFIMKGTLEKTKMSLCEGCYNEAKKLSLNNPSDNNLSLNQNASSNGSKIQTRKDVTSSSLLEKYGKNLNAMASKGLIDKVIGRDKEVEQAVEILNRRNKNNPVLIGEPGVGKTAIAEGIALKIVNGEAPKKLANKIIYALDVASLVASTGVRGQFEERMKKLISELENNPHAILFIDEIHQLVGAGSAEGSMDAGNILKPSLERGRIQLLGATTLKEYRQIEKDPALARRFQSILIEEPSVNETIAILKGILPYYEKYHNVQYTEEAIEACVFLSHRYIQGRQLPDKAIDLLDITGSKINIKQSSIDSSEEALLTKLNDLLANKQTAVFEENFEKAAQLREEELKLRKSLANSTSNRSIILINDVQEAAQSLTGIPVQKLQSEEKEKMKNLNSALSSQIIGQDEAVEKVTKAIRRSKAGLQPKDRPIASFLFTGPTGVGKTELAKTLAKELFGDRDSMIRLDMSEYMEKHSVAKLIGSPPGYIGFDEAGQLTEKIRRNPYNLLLLDELEKAHPEVQNIFLQILDDGHLTDSQGRKVSFKDTVIIATSNAGSLQKKKSSLGFNESNNLPSDSSPINNLQDEFKPEFLNRFDSIVPFNSLAKGDLLRIVDVLLADLQMRLKENSVSLSIKDAAKSALADYGYNPHFGARPLRRAIQEHIEDQLTDYLLNNSNLKNFSIELINDKIELLPYQ